MTIVACSSASSSSSAPPLGGYTITASCKNADLSSPSPSSCGECAATKCADEWTNWLGTDPNAFGGVCGDYFRCTCDCASDGDKPCIDACAAKLGQPLECLAALGGVHTCLDDKCPAECGADAGTVDGSADGG